jgi:hypothetical protein
MRRGAFSDDPAQSDKVFPTDDVTTGQSNAQDVVLHTDGTRLDPDKEHRRTVAALGGGMSPRRTTVGMVRVVVIHVHLETHGTFQLAIP